MTVTPLSTTSLKVTIAPTPLATIYKAKINSDKPLEQNCTAGDGGNFECIFTELAQGTRLPVDAWACLGDSIPEPCSDATVVIGHTTPAGKLNVTSKWVL